eukprot:s3768_g5.t1
MHQFYSNGLVGQDLGLWYTKFKENGFELSFLQRWSVIGWRSLQGGPSPKECVNEKLFREGSDFRGDADTTLQALPLIVSFSKEMLQGNAAMQSANGALEALQDLCHFLQKTKIHPEEAQFLPQQIERYKEKWDVAYAATAWARPKFHYSLHLRRQIEKWGRHIDCFVGERKHRVFKSVVAPRLSQLSSFTRSTLLQMTETELTTSHLEEEYTGRLLGKPTQDVGLAKDLGLPVDVLFAKGIQLHCVEYSRGTFVQLSAMCSIEILGGLLQGDSLSVVVQQLQASMTYASIIKWNRLPNSKQILAASKLLLHEPMRLLRPDQNGLWLLR